ncbi:MAG TPA: EVE domain-containing protein [Polyangiaceae bacterium]|jgi:predicted RNA-binding protein with PUA-like domain|nr:EVE domain-containing protein [Polyangiaceae bacterium]
MAERETHYWLMKSEPDVYSIRHLAAQKRGPWDGVRNFRARNIMKDEMAIGDLVLFHHSNAKPPGIAGIARVCSEAVPDPTQFDPKSKYYDKTAPKTKPRWWMVHVEFVEELPEFLPLPLLREQAKLEGMPLLKPGMRLSVQPVSREHFEFILKLGKSKTKLG